jgi:hypothetical protein
MEYNSLISDFFDNTERLKSEYLLCKSQYAEAKSILDACDNGEARQKIFKIVSYWGTRANAMSSAIGDDVVKTWLE